MLKKYLQALLEAFIGSKKEWISNQSNFASSEYIDINFGHIPNDEEWIAPKNGYIRVVTIDEPDNTACIYLGATSKRTSFTPSISRVSRTGWGAAWSKVKKGEAISFFCGELTKHPFIVFVPDEGAV